MELQNAIENEESQCKIESEHIVAKKAILAQKQAQILESIPKKKDTLKELKSTGEEQGLALVSQMHNDASLLHQVAFKQKDSLVMALNALWSLDVENEASH